MKLLNYLSKLLQLQNNSNKKNLMNSPFWGGFYDRSKVDKSLFTKDTSPNKKE